MTYKFEDQGFLWLQFINNLKGFYKIPCIHIAADTHFFKKNISIIEIIIYTVNV